MPLKLGKNVKEVGHIVSFFSGVAKISGLPHISMNETLLDEKGDPVGIVVGFDERLVDALFFKEDFSPGDPVFRSQQLFSIAHSESFIGRVVNGLGLPRDGLPAIRGDVVPVFRQAPRIIDRGPVNTPLITGQKIIDTTLPLGRGQRELIIGDRKLGKSTLALDTILYQKNAERPVFCIYVLCGKKERQLQDAIALLKEYNAFQYTVVVAATAGDSFAEKYLAPLVGCTIGEYFRDRGEDALIVYDDLTGHAKAYRDIALLFERIPGREAYPGDIFSLHAGLLERSAKMSDDKGGGSLTALPIAETQEGDLSAFIPTNLVSITDGQIYLERGLYQKGFLPAVNTALSVSRVGAHAQPSLLGKVTGGLRLAMSQHRELQKLAQLETNFSKKTLEKIHRGELILELLKQKKHTGISWEEQVILFYTVEKGDFDDLSKDKWPRFENLLLEIIRSRYADAVGKIGKGIFDENVKNMIQELIEDVKHEFLSAV